MNKQKILYILLLSFLNIQQSYTAQNSCYWIFYRTALSAESIIQITGLKREEIRDSYLLDIASGGSDFVTTAVREWGAAKAVAVDKAPRPKNIPEKHYLEMDVMQVDSHEAVIQKLGRRADITVVTSLFGDSTLTYLSNIEDIKEWIEKLIAFTKPGGTIVLDFTTASFNGELTPSKLNKFTIKMMGLSFFKKKTGWDRKDFENHLWELKYSEIIEGFDTFNNISPWIFYKNPHLMQKKPSVVFRITTNSQFRRQSK